MEPETTFRERTAEAVRALPTARARSLLVLAVVSAQMACERSEFTGAPAIPLSPAIAAAADTGSAPVEPAAAVLPEPSEAPAGSAKSDDKEQSARLWAMRKKVQQRSTQRTGSYLEQMTAALNDEDFSGAETALQAAIAQGSLTQAQINEARATLGAKESTILASRLARQQSQENERQQQALAQAGGAQSANASRPASVPEGGKVVSVKFEGWINKARLYNLNGGAIGRASGASPGTVGEGQDYGDKETTSCIQLFIHPGTNNQVAGKYAFKAVWAQHTTPDLTPGGLIAKDGVHLYDVRPVEGIFDIPPGATDVVIKYDKYSAAKYSVSVSN